MNEMTLKRLSLIRYLYRTAEEQARLPEPMCNMSILAFHDAVELFLVLAAERFDVSTKNKNFMEYFDLINAKMESGVLAQKESMRRLNDSRVNFKHHGVLPHKTDIERYRYTVKSFFDDNSELVFNVNFNSVSMVSLVRLDSARECLEEAEKLAEEEKWTDAVNKTALSFSQLLNDYENRKRTSYGKSPFSIGKSMSFNKAIFLGVKDHKWKQFIDDVSESISSLQNAVKMSMFGIDYRHYVVFDMLTPRVIHTVGGLRMERWGEFNNTESDYRFCYEFVVESALRMQDFDFDVEMLENNRLARPKF